MCYTDRQYNNRIAELAELEALKADLEKQISRIKADIQQDMGEAEKVETNKYRILWTVFTSSRLDSKALKADLPEIFQRYAKESTSRRFSYSVK